MGSASSKNKICNNCNHRHHDNSLCTDYTYTNFSQCDCGTRNLMRDRMMRDRILYDFPPITGMPSIFYPDARCSQCSNPCTCKKCNCLHV